MKGGHDTGVGHGRIRRGNTYARTYILYMYILEYARTGIRGIRPHIVTVRNPEEGNIGKEAAPAIRAGDCSMES